MRFVLDTTYLLPLVGISVKNVSTEEVLASLNSANEVALCEISIFELCAKAAKFVSAGKLDTQRVSRGVQAIIDDDSITKLPSYGSRQVSTAIELRGMLGDFIDCMILASALNYGDRLLTEDNDIHELKRNQRFRELAKSVKPGFEIQRL